jgi:hypothetical protein
MYVRFWKLQQHHFFIEDAPSGQQAPHQTYQFILKTFPMLSGKLYDMSSVHPA